MKRYVLLFVSVLLGLAMLAGCVDASHGEAAATESPTTEQGTAATEAPAPEQTSAPTEGEEDFVYEGDAATHYIDDLYYDQIGRYYTPLSEKWDEGQYFDSGLCALPAYYYAGDPLENVGFGFADLDNDGYWELIIGAIYNAEQDPAVFEIWTLKDGAPVLLLQAGSRNHYVLQYIEEDRMWYVVNECANGAANHATYYLMLEEGEFQVVQGIVFDAIADESSPWFMTYDLDWDTSNDVPIDEATAEAILESNRKYYTPLEYFPYLYY